MPKQTWTRWASHQGLVDSEHDQPWSTEQSWPEAHGSTVQIAKHKTILVHDDCLSLMTWNNAPLMCDRLKKPTANLELSKMQFAAVLPWMHPGVCTWKIQNTSRASCLKKFRFGSSTWRLLINVLHSLQFPKGMSTSKIQAMLAPTCIFLWQAAKRSRVSVECSSRFLVAGTAATNSASTKL